ncbi:MAG: hypothetical protein KDD47_08915 [Acidobacteria bacterium]|nr:hypothetical protein [Acidobacteriota bacterium]
MPFAALDHAAVARALSQVADRSQDLVDAFFERTEEISLPAEGGPPGIAVRREEGLAIRLVRDGRTWLASRDGISPALFSDALRQVARAMPMAAYPEPRLEAEPWTEAPEASEMASFPSDVVRHLRQERVAFPLRIQVSRHRRWIQVLGPRLVPEEQRECFYSCQAETPWYRLGVLLPKLDAKAVEAVATPLLESFRCRHAPPPEVTTGVVLLGAEATAVLLHEAVAHALEADTLAIGGKPDAAVGVRLAREGLHVLDDPSSGPEDVRRNSDDEGLAVCRRWLLRDGVVESPLADAAAAQAAQALLPGAARRSHRHMPPVPRSTHLEVIAGEHGDEELAADSDGLWLPRAERGSLDPVTGLFRLTLPHARRLRSGQIAEPVGPCVLEGRVGDLLGTIQGVGNRPQGAGAGWCAKGGQKLPVWATAPTLRLEGARVEP